MEPGRGQIVMVPPLLEARTSSGSSFFPVRSSVLPPVPFLYSAIHVWIYLIFLKVCWKSLDQMSSSIEQMKANVGKLLRGIDRYESLINRRSS